MNERIRLLAEQARLGRGPEKIHISENGVVIFYLDELEKFAKLIVAECVEQGKQIQSQTIIGGSEDYIAGREMGIEVFTNQIKQHFGVEE